MSSSNDLLAIRPCTQPCLLDSCSSQRAGPSSWTRLPRISSSTSRHLSSQANPDHLLEPLDDIPLDSDLDRRASSATLLSHSISSSSPMDQLLKDARRASSESLPARLSESRRLHSLHKPGHMTAQHTQRLRARTAAIITSLPATSEEVVDVDEDEPPKATQVSSEAPRPKLRRVAGVRDLRRAFREGDHGPTHFASISSLGVVSKASYELGFLTNPTQPSSHLSSRSSSRTLVDSLNTRPQSAGDQKTLCGSTFSSASLASRFTTKPPPLPPSRPSHMRSPSDTTQLIFSRKHLVHNSLTLTPRPHRHASLQLDTPPPSSPGEMVWSCAKISQSALKRATRRGPNTPRRVFSNPIAILAS